MADRHLRELNSTATSNSTGVAFFMKCLALQLKYGLSFVNDDEDVDIYSSGGSVSVSAPDGENKQTLTDANAKFSADNVGQNITTTGFTDSNNNVTGIAISDYISATQIKYVNAAGSAEGPVSATWQIAVTNKSFFSTEKDGSNGSINLSGSDYILEDTTAASFVSGDASKYALVVDPTRPENSSIFKIASYTSASQVVINYVSGAGEYPTSYTGADLVWHIFAEDYQVPDQQSEYFRVETPHSYGWALEVSRNVYTTRIGMKARLAYDGNWAGTKVGSYVYCGCNDSNSLWGYASMSSEHINFAFHNSTQNYYGGFLVGNVDQSDTGARARVGTDGSLVAIMGCKSSDSGNWGNTITYERLNTGIDIIGGYMWNDKDKAEQDCYALESTYKDVTESLCRSTSGEISDRTSRWDFIEGQPLVTDYDVTSRQFEIVGYMKGWFLCSQNAPNRNSLDDDDGTSVISQCRFHLYGGNAMSWTPGVTAQH
jgi:hypothetical protein